MNILGICGSLRKASFNRKLLLAAAACLPEGVRMETFNCGDLPLYNADLDGEHKPEPVIRLLNAVRDSDALLFATPEYNFSIPGLLKNALDWASRPAYASVMVHKPTGIISGSIGTVGGARMQQHLKQVLGSTMARIYPSPEFLVPQVQDKFDAGGALKNPEVAEQLKKYISGFVIWAGRVSVL